MSLKGTSSKKEMAEGCVGAMVVWLERRLNGYGHPPRHRLRQSVLTEVTDLFDLLIRHAYILYIYAESTALCFSSLSAPAVTALSGRCSSQFLLGDLHLSRCFEIGHYKFLVVPSAGCGGCHILSSVGSYFRTVLARSGSILLFRCRVIKRPDKRGTFLWMKKWDDLVMFVMDSLGSFRLEKAHIVIKMLQHLP